MGLKRTDWYCKRLDQGYKDPDRIIPASPGKHNLVGSQLPAHEAGTEPLHAPVLDIDFNAKLVPSSTEGHFHLYLDKPMTWKEYSRLLKALHRAGIIEEGYYRSSLKTKQTLVRKPGVTKEPLPVEPLVKIRMEELRDMMLGIIKDIK